MSNTYFRFKQFTIHQDRSAMKVCTDSCILGAWTALRINNAKKILDIGSGTGLLALMLAQKSVVQIEHIESATSIDAIETDPDSVAQARENILQSPWFNRIRMIEADVRVYPFDGTYDFIISNPPFFESDLQSPELKKNKAKHETSLTLEDLILSIDSILKADGCFSILVPFHRSDYFEKLCLTSGFFLMEKLLIRQTPKHIPFRTIFLFSRMQCENLKEEELVIKESSGKYSVEFAELMKEYY